MVEGKWEAEDITGVHKWEAEDNTGVHLCNPSSQAKFNLHLSLIDPPFCICCSFMECFTFTYPTCFFPATSSPLSLLICIYSLCPFIHFAFVYCSFYFWGSPLSSIYLLSGAPICCLALKLILDREKNPFLAISVVKGTSTTKRREHATHVFTICKQQNSNMATRYATFRYCHVTV